MRIIKWVLVVIAILVAFGWAVATGINKQEQSECETWKAEAKEFPGYYLVSWQRDQCAAHGVEIDAPVK